MRQDRKRVRHAHELVTRIGDPPLLLGGGDSGTSRTAATITMVICLLHAIFRRSRDCTMTILHKAIGRAKVILA
jgi:hypothetical protein